MRFLLCLCLLGLTTADLLKDAAPVLDASVLAFFQGSAKAGSLTSALGFYDPEIEQLGDDVERELGSTIQECLRDLLRKIEDHVDNGKQVGTDLIQKIKELREKIKDLGGEKGEKAKEILRKIREKAKEALRNILQRLGLGMRNMDDWMDYTARMKFRELVDRVQEKLQSQKTIDKIREYVQNLFGESKFIRKLKDLVHKLTDDELREILRQLLEPGNKKGVVQRGGEAWLKLTSFFKELNLKIVEHTKKFGQWVKDSWDKGMDKLFNKYGAIRAIAMEYIANSKDMSAEMSREALEFFRPHKDHLGSLWDQLVDATKEAIGHF